MTSFVIGVGVEAPAVTATVSIPFNHSRLISSTDAIRYDGVLARSNEICDKRAVLLLCGSPTTSVKSASPAWLATAS